METSLTLLLRCQRICKSCLFCWRPLLCLTKHETKSSDFLLEFLSLLVSFHVAIHLWIHLQSRSREQVSGQVRSTPCPRQVAQQPRPQDRRRQRALLDLDQDPPCPGEAKHIDCVRDGYQPAASVAGQATRLSTTHRPSYKLSFLRQTLRTLTDCPSCPQVSESVAWPRWNQSPSLHFRSPWLESKGCDHVDRLHASETQLAWHQVGTVTTTPLMTPSRSRQSTYIFRSDRFLMNGKALCLMSLQMFTFRVPLGGKLLFKDFQLRLSSATYHQDEKNCVDWRWWEAGFVWLFFISNAF